MSFRENAVNVFAGALLLGSLALAFAAGVAALYVIHLAVRHFFPAVSVHPEIELCGLMFLALLISALRQLRKQVWSNALLSLAAAATILLAWLLNPMLLHHASQASTFTFNFPILCVMLAIPSREPVPRNEFFVCAAIIAGVFAFNAGLLGSGSVTTTLEAVFCFAVICWTIARARAYRFAMP
jgi:hypothetical protein